MQKKTIIRIALVLLSLLPAGYLIHLVLKYHVDVPILDQWELIPVLDKTYKGSLTIKDIWQPHNEHIIFFPKLIMIKLARSTRWSILYELLTNILLGIGIFVTICYQLIKTDRIGNLRTYLLIPIVSLITFSINQSQNWLWGWQIQMFLNVLAVAVGIMLLAYYAEKWLHFSFALFMGIIAAYSFSNGVVYWAVGLLVLFFVRHANRKSKVIKIIIWICASLLIAYTYWPLFVYKCQRPTDHTPLSFILQHKLEFTRYVLAYLGNPVCNYYQATAIISGIFGLVVFGFSASFLLISRRVGLNLLLPYIGMGLYVLGSAILTGTGRAGLGVEQAMVPRYATIANLFWISNIVLLFIFADAPRDKSKSKTVPRWFVTGPIVIIIVLVMTVNSVKAVKNFKNYYELFSRAQIALRTGTNELFLKLLYPDVKVVKERRVVLKKYELSAFREDGDEK